jgi:hypothetical protein
MVFLKLTKGTTRVKELMEQYDFKEDRKNYLDSYQELNIKKNIIYIQEYLKSVK